MKRVGRGRLSTQTLIDTICIFGQKKDYNIIYFLAHFSIFVGNFILVILEFFSWLLLTGSWWVYFGNIWHSHQFRILITLVIFIIHWKNKNKEHLPKVSSIFQELFWGNDKNSIQLCTQNYMRNKAPHLTHQYLRNRGLHLTHQDLRNIASDWQVRS